MINLYKFINYAIWIISIIIFIILLVLLLILNIKPTTEMLLQLYSVILTGSVTILGFYITAVSILLFAFKEASEKGGNILNAIKNSRSYPQLYTYFLRAIYVFGVLALLALIFYLINLITSISYGIEDIMLAIIILPLSFSFLYGAVTIYLFGKVIGNFVK